MGLFPCGYWHSKRCWYIWPLNVMILFEFLIFIGIEFHSAQYWDSFLSNCCSSIIYMYIRAVSSYSLKYLVSKVKVNLFTFESAETYRFLYIKDASFSWKILLKLIHFKSRNSWVTWSRFKYFPLLATFAAKLIHFCTSYCRFSLHLPHIELQ